VRDPGVRAQVGQLAARYGLDHSATDRLGALLDFVVSDPLAPTAVRDPRKVSDDHLADSLVALELEAVRSVTVLADLGSGPGFPGLPLAIALPDARVDLVESSGSKCAFIGRAAAACSVGNARAVHARAESWQEGLGANDVITARALAPLEVVVEYAGPLLRIGGSLVAWRGRRDTAAEQTAKRAAAQLGLEPQEVRHVEPYRGAERRHLHVFSKVRETPEGFPRRPGVARKRPLGHAGAASDRVSH
jgi:16S rRNA (guanine527-N7)-methyltransferase